MRPDILEAIPIVRLVFAPVSPPLLTFPHLVMLAPLRISNHSATVNDPAFVKRRDGKRHQFGKKATVIARANAATATNLLRRHRFAASLKPTISLGVMH
jgi:hypothetical protein